MSTNERIALQRLPGALGVWIERQSSCSFAADSQSLRLISRYLVAHGFAPTRNRGKEWQRLILDDAIVILYHTGSILCQGRGAARAIELLDAVASPAEGEQR